MYNEKSASHFIQSAETSLMFSHKECVEKNHTDFPQPVETDLFSHDEKLNNVSRAIAKGFGRKNKDAVLVRLNDGDIFTKFEEDMNIYNFIASAIMPCNDKELYDMITKWRKESCVKTLDRIINKISKEGELLLWS